MAYRDDGTPLYSKFNEVVEIGATLQASFELITPVSRRDEALGRSVHVTHDTYTSAELARLIEDVEREGRNAKMLKAAKIQLDKARERRKSRVAAKLTAK